MNKLAYFRYAGRDLGLRHALSALVDDLDKTAEADEDLVAATDEAVSAIEFNDEVVKRAHNMGVLSAYGQVLEQIEAGTPVEKIAEQLSAAVDNKLASAFFPSPESEDEAAQLQDELVKGAAEAIGMVAGVDPTSDEVLDAAIELVSASLEANS